MQIYEIDIVIQKNLDQLQKLFYEMYYVLQ